MLSFIQALTIILKPQRRLNSNVIKIKFTILPKPHTHLQTMIKRPICRCKTVGGVAHKKTKAREKSRGCDNHKQKVREKPRECHNHKPQPFSDTKRNRKPIKPNKHTSNKRTKNTKICSLFPKRCNSNAKRSEKHKNKITRG